VHLATTIEIKPEYFFPFDNGEYRVKRVQVPAAGRMWSAIAQLRLSQPSWMFPEFINFDNPL